MENWWKKKENLFSRPEREVRDDEGRANQRD